jgi:hypothetical protein
MESRFFHCSEEMRGIWNKYDVYFSKKFCNYFADSVKEIFYREAGLKSSFKVGLSLFRENDNLPMYEPGPVSRINTAISILPEFIDPIVFCWKSKTGLIVHTYDEDFDETDLECWIEGIKPALYLQQLTTVNVDHPLKLKNLPYELAVYGIGMHMGLTTELTDVGNAAEIIKQLGDEVEKHNQKSEAKGRANGVVHNCSGEVSGNEIIFRIDVGSAGVVFIKKLLRLLAKHPEVKKVTVDL